MKITQALLVKASSVASATTKRISGQFNPLALSVSRSLAVFGKTFLGGLSGFSFQEGEDVSKLANRSVKNMQRVGEERKEKAVKKNQKEIEMLVGVRSLLAQQLANAPAQDQSFCSRVNQEKSYTPITLKGESLTLKGDNKEWGNKVNNTSVNSHNGSLAL